MKYTSTKKLTRGQKRTLENFKDTMFLFLSKKSFENITVNEICSEANYPRATFYNYFDDKYDLLNYCWIWLAEEIHLEEYHNTPHNQMLYIFFDRILDFSEEHREMMQKILKNNPETGYMVSCFQNFMKSQMRLIFQYCSPEQDYPIPRDIIANHYSNTILLVWEWCYSHHKSCTIEDAHEYLRYLVGNM